MSNIPSSVRVAGIDYYVGEVFGINERYNTLGQVIYSKGTIELDAELNHSRKEQVFVHEVLHAIFNEAGFEDQDEDMINRVGIVLYQVLKDNKLYFGE